jgi:cell division initiation protein
MKLTPLDVKKQEFKKVMRGFDPVEVETFLGMVANELEELTRANRDLKDKLIELEARLQDYRSIEKTLQQTLATAQEAGAKSIENARKEAQMMITEARMKANQIVEKSRNDLIMMKEGLAILKSKKTAIISRLRTLLGSELQLIQALEVDEELQEESKEDRQRDQVEIEEIIKNLDQSDNAFTGNSA